MSRSKTLAHYPSRYAEIVMECAVAGKEVTVACENTKQAASMRGHWYSFIGALKSEDKAAKVAIARSQTAMPSDHQKYVMDLAAQAQRVLVTVIAQPPAVLFQNRDSSWQAKLLSKATVTEGPPVVLPQAVEDAGDRLMKLQKETDDGHS